MEEQSKLICPACEIGTLRAQSAQREYTYGDQAFGLTTLYSLCDECGTELVTPEQAKANDRLIREEHRRIDGFLSATQIRAIRTRLDITQQDAACLFGGGPNAFSKYERVEVVQSVAMDRLMRVVDAVPGAFDALVQIVFGTAKIVNIVKSAPHVCIGYAHDDAGELARIHLAQEPCLSWSLVRKKSSNQTYRQVERYKEAG